MATVEVDTSGLAGLAQDLRLGYREAAADARRELGRSARRVRDDWRKAWAGIGHAPHLAAAVTYEVRVNRMGVVAEIGPDKSRPQGALGNIIEFGTAKNGPIPGGGPATRAEEPRLIAAVERLADPLR